MALARIPLPEQPTVDFVTKCEEWLQRAEGQKALAREMIKRMRDMRRRASEMRQTANRRPRDGRSSPPA
jgi:hypothetical protein